MSSVQADGSAEHAAMPFANSPIVSAPVKSARLLTANGALKTTFEVTVDISVSQCKQLCLCLE